MILTRLFFIASLSLTAMAAPASSKDVTAPMPEQLELVEAIEAFNEAMRDEEYSRVISALPQSVLAHSAEAAGVEVDEFVKRVGMIVAAVMKDAEGMTFSMDTDAIKYYETSDDRLYALIPTQTVIPMEDGALEQNSHTLSFEEDGEWRFLRVSDAKQVVILRDVYPDFEGVEFPSGSVATRE